MLKKISISKLQELMAHDSELIILDVRTFQAYQAGHITGAMSVPLHEISRNASKIPRNKKIAVYCQNALCSMSTQAVLELQNLGFQNIHKLDGGFDEWKVIGHPIKIES
ncbi:MAG: rhodanese-like domain-containing protein, partial [Candidatus Hodarchaeales archaeon]